MIDFFREQNKKMAKKMNDDGELVLMGMCAMAQQQLTARDSYLPIIIEVVDVFLDTALKYDIESFNKYLDKIKIWEYSDFCKQFKTLSDFYSDDNLLDIIGALFDIDCYWTKDDWCNNLVICYDYFEDDCTNVNDINILGTYMECERLLTLYEHEILSWTDIESSICVFDEYLNNYLGDWNIDNYNDEYECCWAILDRIDQLIGGVL